MQPTNESGSTQSRSVLKSYILGFSLSILTTGVAYFFAKDRILPSPILTYALLTLALIQAGVQLVLFLHVGKEAKPQWNLLVFLFMLSILIILVAGSIWIMYHLNYNVMPKME